MAISELKVQRVNSFYLYNNWKVTIKVQMIWLRFLHLVESIGDFLTKKPTSFLCKVGKMDIFCLNKNQYGPIKIGLYFLCPFVLILRQAQHKYKRTKKSSLD
jgi:hypothetical protein